MKKDWEIKKLGDVCEVINGKNQKAVEDKNGSYPIYGSGGIMGYASEYLCRENTTIIGRKGSINNPLYVEEKFWNVDTAFGFQSKDNYLPKLLFYFCKSFDFSTHNKGTTIPSLVKSDLLEIPIPVPPLEEQKRIVKILDEKFVQLETIKANAQTNLQNAKDLFQSQLTKAFSNTTWEKISVKDAGITLTGTTPPTSNKSNYGDYIPFIKPGDINIDSQGGLNYYNEGLSEEGYKKSRMVKAGSTLMVCIGATIGKVGFTEKDITCNQQINAIIPSEDFYPKFIYYSMINKDFQNEVLKYGKASQATLPIINKSKWENLIFSYPKSKNEQKRIVKELDTLSENIRQLQEIYTKQIANCDELKQSLLQKAFEGEL